MSDHKEPETLDAEPPDGRADYSFNAPAEVRPFVEPSISPPADILENTKFFALASLPPRAPGSNRPSQPAPSGNRT